MRENKLRIKKYIKKMKKMLCNYIVLIFFKAQILYSLDPVHSFTSVHSQILAELPRQALNRPLGEIWGSVSSLTTLRHMDMQGGNQTCNHNLNPFIELFDTYEAVSEKYLINRGLKSHTNPLLSYCKILPSGLLFMITAFLDNIQKPVSLSRT